MNDKEKINKLKKEIEVFKEEIETQKKYYRALEHGDYVVENHSKDRVFTVNVVMWERGCGTTILKAITFDIKNAKIIELALKKVFPTCEVSTSTKKDVYADNRDFITL